MSEECCYIPDDDGYTENVFIDRVPRIHPAVRMSYRPMRVMERIVTQEELRSKSLPEGERIVAQCVADRIIDWDIRLANGEKAPITAKFIHLLKGPLYQRLCRIVYFNTDGGDPDPKASPEKRVSDLTAKAKAAESGITVQDADRGN